MSEDQKPGFIVRAIKWTFNKFYGLFLNMLMPTTKMLAAVLAGAATLYALTTFVSTICIGIPAGIYNEVTKHSERGQEDQKNFWDGLWVGVSFPTQAIMIGYDVVHKNDGENTFGGKSNGVPGSSSPQYGEARRQTFSPASGPIDVSHNPWDHMPASVEHPDSSDTKTSKSGPESRRLKKGPELTFNCGIKTSNDMKARPTGQELNEGRRIFLLTRRGRQTADVNKKNLRTTC